jgi:deoxycytidine triphosphate deaminase
MEQQTLMPDRYGLLTGDALRGALEDERVFAAGTWRLDCVRGAAYDLRLASDLCIVPDSGGTRIYERSQIRNRPIILEPGDTAIVSTAERIALDWTLTGVIGTKFSMSSQGIIVLTGLCVDPGYGYKPVGDVWIPETDQRLHFVLFNAGPTGVVLRPGFERIAVMQLFDCEEPKLKTFTPSTGFEHLQAEYFATGGHGVGLTYFRDLRDTLALVRDHGAKVDAFESRLVQAESAINNAVVFGIYLVAVTILGVALALGLNISGSIGEAPSSWQLRVAVGSVTIVSLMVMVVTVLAVRHLLAGRRPHS